jgi:putative transcriptional regulator
MHQRLRTLRTQRGLTLKKISEGTGLAISTLHEIEKHERDVTLTTAFRLARFYGMPVAEIWRPLFQQICQEAPNRN